MKLSRIWSMAILPLLLLACQDDIPGEQELTDEDMEAAILLADEHFQSESGRSYNANKIVTVIKFKDNQLFYKTSKSGVESYELLEETSVTAFAKPGDFIYWYSGGGVTDLEEIDFDDDDEDYLDDLPEEINMDRMFVLRVPLNYNTNHAFLKYDIVYESKNNRGMYIRLDPKIGVIDDDDE